MSTSALHTSASETHIGPTLRLPSRWPSLLRPNVLATAAGPTPFLLGSTELVTSKLRRFRSAVPQVQPFYAVKCNPDANVLTALAADGCRFEVASLGELDLLVGLGVHASDVLYSNTVKPASHVKGAAELGLWRFAVDSAGEVAKIAREAPGSAVYVRLAVDDDQSAFPLSRKFGVDGGKAVALLLEARNRGLRPYGLTFHVGSQSTAPSAWTTALRRVALIAAELLDLGIHLDMVDIGGGFPAWYGTPVPEIEEIGAAITRGLESLPYTPDLLAAEPGRHLAAESAVMVSSVLGRERRGGQEWLHTDVSAYHGLIETQQSPSGWPYPLWTSRSDHTTAPSLSYVVTGPTCDSADTFLDRALLPATMAEGDRLYIASAGAYTLSYASSFNGFPPPQARYSACGTSRTRRQVVPQPERAVRPHSVG